MNWKLTLLLSLFGVVMGFASIFGWIQGLEPFLWPLIGITCAIWIATKAPARHFLHGFLVGLIGGGVAPLIQALFFDTYIAHSREFAESLSRLPSGLRPRAFVFLLVPIIALISAGLLGFLAWLAAKIIRRPPTTSL